MQNPQIVGSVQVRNEDIYIERAVLNILDFCDKVIITDHQSTDRTFEICRCLSDQYPKIELTTIQNLREATVALEPYFGTNTWIFGVDGDEIYDPVGLATLRCNLLAGVFSKHWCIFGNVLNVTSIDLKHKTAKGFLAPPSRSMTKLYNFSMIESWNNCSERLLGEDIRFKDGFNTKLRRYLHLEMSWDQSYYRCLHLPFMKRSSQQKLKLARTRLNPDEINTMKLEKNNLMRILRFTQIHTRRLFGVDWKGKKYRQGPLVEKDVASFQLL